MNFPSREFDDAVSALCHGTIGAESLADLHELLRTSPDAQDEYLWRVEVHGALLVHPARFEEATAQPAPQKSQRPIPVLLLVASLVFLLSAGLWIAMNQQAGKNETVARITLLDSPVWTDPKVQMQTGEAIVEKQRMELQSGVAELVFDSGARLRLVGPAIVEPLSANSARLVLGEVSLTAETLESKGFTLVTPTSSFVDIGTAFTASVAPDGLSRLEVSEGEVDVVLDEQAQTPRLKAGATMYVEPGKQKITTRIEEGDGTAAFRFPTIAPPSKQDYADQAAGKAAIRVVSGILRKRPGPASSGAVDVLLDGMGQSRQDAPQESAFFEQDHQGRILLDLGTPVSITRINSYSWHQHARKEEHRHRARQTFTLYGLSGDVLLDPALPPARSGWTRIARVNSDRFFRVTEALDRPAQQASSIAAARGEVGRYRYLLWEIHSPTLFGEFDVIVTP